MKLENHGNQQNDKTRKHRCGQISPKNKRCCVGGSACAVQSPLGFWQKMASAKFLEEALSNDVDESAVNAIVGSLETQLGSTGAAGGVGATNAAPAASPQLNGPTKHNGGAPDVNNGDPTRTAASAAAPKTDPGPQPPPPVNGIVTPPILKPTVISNGATAAPKAVPPPALVPTAAPAMQLVNVNQLRPAVPNAAPGTTIVQGQKGMPQRVVIGAPQMVGARPGQPGVCAPRNHHRPFTLYLAW